MSDEEVSWEAPRKSFSGRDTKKKQLADDEHELLPVRQADGKWQQRATKKKKPKAAPSDAEAADSTETEAEAAAPAVDELEVELWEQASHGPRAAAAEATGATRMLGTCAISVIELLTGERLQVSARLPVTAPSGLVVGTVHVYIEGRGARRAL